MKGLAFSLLSLTLALIITFGSLAHALLPHTHSPNEAVTSLLHSALRHEDKKFTDLIPPTPLFVPVVVALLVLVSIPAILPAYALSVHPPSLALLRRGVLPYRRFG